MRKSFNLFFISSLLLTACGSGQDTQSAALNAQDALRLSGSDTKGNICSNGRLNPGEECDDGNLKDGDGCDSSCKIESGYECFYSPSQCQLICSNGRLDEGEECDDGNLENNDGCSNDCKIEAGFDCDTLADPTFCEPTCGNGYLDDGEECDDGNYNNNDGCSECHLTAGFDCNTFIEPTFCQSRCGNGYLDAGEQCDDGNYDNNDGCSECQIMDGYDCITDIEPTICRSFKRDPGTCDKPYEINDLETVLNLAGQSLDLFQNRQLVIKVTLKAGEELNAYFNGLSSNILSLYNGSCTGTLLTEVKSTSITEKILIYRAAEDMVVYLVAKHNSSYYYYSNYRLLAKIRQPVCGDGLLDDNEVCDDGNLENGDGCSSNCQIESDSHCRTRYTPAEYTLDTGMKQKYSVCESGVSDYTGNGDTCENPAVLIGRAGFFMVGDAVESWTNNYSITALGSNYQTNCKEMQDIVLAVTLKPEEIFTLSDTNRAQKALFLDKCDPAGTIIKNSSGDISYTNTAEEEHTLFIVAKSAYLFDCSSTNGNFRIDDDQFYYTITKEEEIIIPDPFCGDGIRSEALGEACDDGNNLSGDGCAADCSKVESDWSCPAMGGKCSLRFDVVKPGERVHNLLTTWLCNDGNDIAGDGCYNWHIEPGWNCWQKQENGYIQNVPCYRLCGNTQIDDGESCDDGNQLDGDGCSKLCQQEDGYSCDGLHCYLLNQTDTKHNGNSPTDAIDIAADKYQITLEDFTANGYILDKSCTDYSDDSTSQKALFIKTNLTAGQMLKAFMATEEEQKQYSVNYIRSINGNTVTCYRKDSYGKFFASKNQTLTMIVKQRNSATGTPAFRMHKYYPICGDGTAEGFEQCDPGTPMEASKSYKYCENCMLVGNDAGNKSCAWVSDAQEYYCSTYTHYTGFAGSCGGAAVFEDKEGSVTTYFKYKYNQDNEFMRANSARSWEPDISSCTGGDTSLNNHYSFIMRYDLKAGDRLTFSGKTYNSYDGVIKDTFYIVGDDCWHGQCLFSGSAGLDNTWVSDKDQQVWAVIQQSIYWAGTFDSASITLERAN